MSDIVRIQSNTRILKVFFFGIVVLLSFSCRKRGCMDENAMNYDADADQDSGFCLFPGCIDEEAVNFDGLANVDDGTCSYQPCPDFNGDGLVQVEDLMNFLLVWGTVYD